MNDQDKTKQQLLEALADLRRQAAEQEAQLTQYQQAEIDRQQISDNLPVLITTASFDGYYKTVNTAFERTLGWSKQEMLSRPFMEFIHPDDRALGMEAVEQVKSGKTLTNFADRTLCKDGSYRWINWTVIPFSNRDVVFATGKDITKQKQVEEELKRAHNELEERVKERTAELIAVNKTLRESEEKFRTFIDVLPDGLIECDLKGNVTYASRQIIQMCRLENAEEIVAKSPMNFLVPEDHQKFLDSVQKTLTEGITKDIPYECVRKDKTHFLAEASAAIVNDMSGKPKGFVAIVRDVTERKRAEEILRQKHDELRAIHDGMNDGFLVADAETKQFVQANASICRMLGYSEEELLSKSVMDIHQDEDLPTIMEIFQSQIEGHFRIATDLPMKRKDGSTFFADIGSDKVLYNGRPCLIGFFHDVTERKLAEETLRQSHDELRAIYDGIVEGLLVTDVKTLRFVRANASICRMLGYSEAELLSLSLKDIHPAEVIPEILENIHSVDVSNHPHPGNIPFLRKDGSVFYTEAIGKSLIYDGKPCSMGIFRDITERLQAEAALEQERQSLWKMLQASDHERQTISYDIHDGLAQYLAAANMGFQTYDSMKENSPDEARKAYETAVELVHQAHSEARRLIGEVRHPVIDERGLATAIVSLAYEQQRRGGPKIECHTSVEFNRLPPILENALYRMAQEALTNARKHSKSEKVTVTMIQEGQDVHLKIQDWGTGFDTETSQKGHFGLESIRQRVRLLGGQLTIESKLNSGTLIQIVVPILEK